MRASSYETVPELPITAEERAAAWRHPEFASLEHIIKNGEHQYWVVDIGGSQQPFEKAASSPDDALDAFIRAHRGKS